MSAVDRLALLDTLAAAITKAGQHDPSPFWWGVYERFYDPARPELRSLVARVGRGGAKSYNSCVFALNEVLFGGGPDGWQVPPGERHYFAFVSARKAEVSERRTVLESMLRALEIPHHTSGDVVHLDDRPLGFRFYACDVNAVSGFRCIGYAADELAKWAWELDASDPAREVLTSLEAMTITHREARSWLISSPWSIDDEHAQRFDRGDTANQIVAYAPTWEANPGVTREDCIAKAKGNMREFRREYEALPATTDSNALDLEDIENAIAKHAELAPGQAAGPVFCAIDSSAGKQDSFAWALFSTPPEGGIVMLKIDGVHAHERLSREAVIARVAEDCRTHRASLVFGDHYGKGFIEAHFAKHGLALQILDWTMQSKNAAFGTLRALLRDGEIALPPDPRLKSELANMRAVLSPYGSGLEKFATNGKDFASTLVTACIAIASELVHVEIGMGVALPEVTPEGYESVLMAAMIGMHPSAYEDQGTATYSAEGRFADRFEDAMGRIHDAAQIAAHREAEAERAAAERAERQAENLESWKAYGRARDERMAALYAERDAADRKKPPN